MDDSDPLGAYGLAKIELQHKSLFDTRFAPICPQLSDYTFANTFIWRDSIHIRWRMIHGCLCVFANGEEGLSLLFPPLGEGRFGPALNEAMEICRAFNAEAHIEQQPRVEYINEALLSQMPGGAKVQVMSGDYIYSTRKMIDLDGGELASKRSGRNYFLRHYQVRTETFGPEHVAQCLALLGLWQAQTEQTTDKAALPVCIKRCKEITATVNSVLHAQALGLTGMVLYANEKLVGFTLGEILNDKQTCNIIIEKADRNYRGAANYIFSEFCRAYWSHSRWCNAGDDWDVPSLAWTKQSYRPAFRLCKWVAWPALPVRVAVAAKEKAKEIRAQAAARLVRAGLADLNQLLLLESQCFEKSLSFNRRQLRYLLGCPRATIYTVRRNEQLLAAAVLLRRRSIRGTAARLYSIAVEPSHQRRGYARLLIKRCLRTLRAEGISIMHLEVEQTNGAALALYESMGFMRGRQLSNYYGTGRHGWKMKRQTSHH